MRHIVPLLLALGACTDGAAPAAAPATTIVPVVLPPAPTVERGLGIAATPPLGADPASTRQREEDLDAIAGAGFAALRTDFLWSDIERSPGAFDLAAHDRLVDAARARGVEVVGLLAYGNAWAARASAGDDAYPPDDPADFARFVATTVAHFRGRVRRWEVWNEPNVGLRFWKPGPAGDAAAYGALLERAARAARAADPDARVAAGGTFWPEAPGLFPGTLAFTDALLAARPDLARDVDAVAVHPYRYPFLAPEAAGLAGLPSQEPLIDALASLRDLLARRSAARPLWITEVGWHTATASVPFAGVSEEAQARWLVRATALALAADVELVCWYTLRDGPRWASWQEDAFGLLAFDPDRDDATPAREKPALRAHRTLAAQLAGTRFERELTLPDARALRFAAPDREVTIVWRERGAARALVPVPDPPRARVVDLLGAVRPVTLAGGAVDVVADEAPTYVVGPR